MKVLVATKESQGALAGDYFCGVEGELVTPVVLECCSPGTCGCGRGFPGLASARATTSAMIVERPEIGRDDLIELLYDSLDRQGWLQNLDPDEIDEVVDEHLECIRIVCSNYPLGTVVARWGTKVWSRAEAAAA